MTLKRRQIKLNTFAKDATTEYTMIKGRGSPRTVFIGDVALGMGPTNELENIEIKNLILKHQSSGFTSYDIVDLGC